MGYNYGKIWVAGAHGRVGTMIHNMLDMRDVELFETGHEELDITDAVAVNRFGSSNRPNTIINCAGFTDVRACEENIEEAYKVNALGARNLSAIARKIDARIIQISTDDIFCDSTRKSFHEFDTPNPKTVYGKSKLAGENFVKELAPKHLIIRSSWVYGKEGDNFVNYIIDCAKNGKTIEAAVDDFACPTSAKELSKVILRLIQAEQEGIYHAVCDGFCSRYELAEEILKLLGKEDVQLIPKMRRDMYQGRDSFEHVNGQNLSTAIKMTEECGSRYTILDNMMLRMCGIECPVSWQEALEEYIRCE